MLSAGKIGAGDANLLTLVDTAEEAVAAVLREARPLPVRPSPDAGP